MEHLRDEARRDVKADRFARIAGQVQGIARMVAEDRYRMDVLSRSRQ